VSAGLLLLIVAVVAAVFQRKRTTVTGELVAVMSPDAAEE
jgi:hypothetical protein